MKQWNTNYTGQPYWLPLSAPFKAGDSFQLETDEQWIEFATHLAEVGEIANSFAVLAHFIGTKIGAIPKDQPLRLLLDPIPPKREPTPSRESAEINGIVSMLLDRAQDASPSSDAAH